MCDWGIDGKENDTGAQTKGIVVLQEGKRMMGGGYGDGWKRRRTEKFGVT